jgi:phosphate ABC transporter permease subunit PstA
MDAEPVSAGVPMSLIFRRTPRNPLREPYSPMRRLMDRGFAVVAFAATFFGLAMLLVFFVQLSMGAYHWFETMPRLVEARNRVLVEQAAQAQNFTEFAEKELKQAIGEMEDELKAANSVDEKNKIIQYYEGRIGLKTLPLTNERDGKFAAAKSEPEKQAIRKQYDAQIAEAAAPLRKEMQDSLAKITDTEARRHVIKEYEGLVGANRLDLEKNAHELIKAKEGIRTDTGPAALLTHFLTSPGSSEVQDAGIMPALLGSIFIAIITVFFAVPLGVGAAVYLEEYKRSGWLSRIIQVNISNLAAVPSVVYGILGAYVFVDMVFRPLEQHWGSEDYGFPFGKLAARNLLGGGLTLSLLTLPVIIVAAQEAIRAVPVSIRHGALALGATRFQVVWHHVLPNAFPGILTGTILGMSRAIGEAAPLVMFGAILLVSQNPELLTRFTVMPMQIFGWTEEAGEAWKYNAAMASAVLLLTLLGLNAVAIVLRARTQQRLS